MTFKTENPQCGDIFLVHVPGIVGFGIGIGQQIVGSTSYFTHCGIVGPAGEVAIAAQPGGAIQTTLRDALPSSGRVVYSDFILNVRQRSEIWSAAQQYLGTPYSFADYAAIAALRLLHTDALEAFVRDSGHMICSQLADQCYLDAGVKLLDRAAGDVAPGDIANLIGAK